MIPAIMPGDWRKGGSPEKKEPCFFSVFVPPQLSRLP